MSRLPDPREVPDAIEWHEGMLLAPQHFQELSRRHEGLLSFHAAVISPFHWGVLDLKPDLAALAGGRFRVAGLRAVLPDGLSVSCGPGELEADVSAAARAPVTVHLAVPRRRAGASPVRGEMPRYDAFEGDPLPDETTGEGDLRIPRLRPHATLAVLPVGEVPSGKFVSFPLARVVRSGEAFALAEDYEPPSLAAGPGSRIAGIAADVVRRLREKAAVLLKRARSGEALSQRSQLLETRVMLHGLVAALPPLEAVLATGRAHPYALYLALAGVVGSVATVSRGLLPPELPPYNHDDPLPGFERAREFVARALSEGIAEPYTGFPFHRKNGGFGLFFEEPWRDRPLVLGVRGREGVPEKDVADWVGGALIGSQGRIREMRERRVLGAGRSRAEADLVPVSGFLLFSLQAGPDAVDTGQILEIVNPADRGDAPVAEIVLYVRNPWEGEAP